MFLQANTTQIQNYTLALADKKLQEALVAIHDLVAERILTEAGRRRVIKVNAKGQRRRKILCGRGKKLVDGTRCVVIGGSEKAKMRMAKRRAVRTLRSKGAGARRRANIKRARAFRRRKSFGLDRRRR